MNSGCIGGTMQLSVNIGCGWRMVGVTNTCHQYEATCDQYGGRILSGLPLFSSCFAVLPHPI